MGRAYPGSLKASDLIGIRLAIEVAAAPVGQRFRFLEVDMTTTTDVLIVCDISGTWLHPQDSTP